MASQRNPNSSLVNSLGEGLLPGDYFSLNEQGFVGLLGILLVAMITMFLLFLALNYYDSNTLVTTISPDQSNKPGNISTGSYPSVLQSTTQQLKAIEKQQQQAADQILRDMQGVSMP